MSTESDPAAPLPEEPLDEASADAEMQFGYRRAAAKVREFPQTPGVYLMKDGRGRVIYVGKAKNLRARLLSYFRPNSRDAKAGHILKETRTLAWEIAPSEFAALLRELELIQRWQPRFNVQGQPRYRRRVYVCVGRRPAATIFLSRQPPRTAFAHFGPVPSGMQAGEAVRRLNDWFRLRDCAQSQTMTFADQPELFALPLTPGCIRHEIGTCLGPCAAVCSREEYAAQVRAVLSFLRGEEDAPLTAIEREMSAASASLEFERAAALRDKLETLTWLCDQLRRVREASRHSFVYPVRGHEETELWYLIRGGRVGAVVPAPQDEASWCAAAKMLEAVYAGAEKTAGPPGLSEIDCVLLVDSWFRRHPEEQQRTIAPAIVGAENA